MQSHPLGRTGLNVSALGFGAGQIGGEATDDGHVGRLLNTALDAGVTFIDTARGYGQAEERIGRHLSHRRDEFVLCTKVGYDVEGHRDWTPECVVAGVDKALRLLKTDRLDIALLHSCPLDVLRRPGLIEALTSQVEAGKVRCAGYSGENEALDYAVASGAFTVIECSVNVADQRSLSHPLPQAREAGMGIIAKRPLGNAFWRFQGRPHGQYCETYWLRAHAMDLTDAAMPWDELSLRFLQKPGLVDTVIAGTANLDHLHRNIALVEKGPLPDEVFYDIRRRFVVNGGGWRGEI